MVFRTESAEQTEALGQKLGASLPAGSVVAFRGGLGMGKTAFTRGLARGLGCTGPQSHLHHRQRVQGQYTPVSL